MIPHGLIKLSWKKYLGAALELGHLMAEKEMKSMAKQLTFCYSQVGLASHRPPRHSNAYRTLAA
jgi:hypothetical protein